MAAQARGSAPGGVKFVAILAILVGLLQLIGGVLLLVFNGDVNGYSSSEASIVGVVLIVIGLIYLLVGRGLLRLSPTAFMIGLFFSALKAVYDVVWLIAVGLDGIGFSGLISLVINVIVFAALWSGRDAFDRGGRLQSA